MTIEELNTKIQAIDIDKMLEGIIEKNEKAIILYNTEQLKAGFKNDGSSIGQYRPMSIRLRKKAGLQVNYVDTYFTGAWHRGFVINNKGNDYDITSTDFKTAKLVSQYGKELFGIAPEDMNEINDNILTPQLTDVFKKAIK